MGNQHTQVRGDSTTGEFQLQHTSTDSPILPVESMRAFKEIDESIIPYILAETKAESEHRRAEHKKVDWFIFFERVLSILSPVIVAIVGLALAFLMVMAGHDWAGAALGTGSLGTIVAIIAKVGIKKDPQPHPTPRRTRAEK